MTVKQLKCALDELWNTPEGTALRLRLSAAALIAEGMKRKGWDSLKLAKESGLPLNTVSSILSSDCDCRCDTLGRLFHALDMRVRLVVTGD